MRSNYSSTKNKPGPTRVAKEAKTPVLSLELLIIDEIFEEITTNAYKRIRSFVQENANGYCDSGKITQINETNTIEVKALIGLMYLWGFPSELARCYKYFLPPIFERCF